MHEYKILKQVKVHHCLNNIHKIGDEFLQIPIRLILIQYPHDNGFYVIRIGDGDKELTDTYHDTVKDAIDQCLFEYGIKETEWEDFSF